MTLVGELRAGYCSLGDRMKAADRIERLETALKELMDLYGDHFDDTMMGIAKDALEGK